MFGNASQKGIFLKANPIASLQRIKKLIDAAIKENSPRNKMKRTFRSLGS